MSPPTTLTAPSSHAHNSHIKVKLACVPLADRPGYHIWSVRVKAWLRGIDAWDEAKSVPISSPAVDSEIIGALSDSCLNLVLHTDQTAQTIWQYFANEWINTDLAAQSDAFGDLANFNYAQQKTMLDAKTFLLNSKRNLRAAFGNAESITFDQLITLFAVIRLPLEYQPLRTTIQETATSTDFDKVFASIAREERSLLSSGANRAVIPNLSNKCPHNRQLSTCWTCDPSLKPADCPLCSKLNFTRLTHTPESSFCKKQRKSLSSANRSSRTQINAKNSASDMVIRFNVDSGATDTIINNRSDLQYSRPINHPIRVSNNSIMMANAIGTIQGINLDLLNVLACPQASENLLSVAKITDQGYDVLFNRSGLHIGTDTRMVNIVMSGSRTQNSYYLDFDRIASSRVLWIDSASSAFIASSEEWHMRFNHLNYKDLRKLESHHLVTGIEIDRKNSALFCKECQLGKFKKGSVPKQSSFRATRVAEVVWFDIIVIHDPISNSGYRYILVFLDDFSRAITTYLLKTKSEVFSKFKDFDSKAFNRLGYHITYLRSDNAGENKSSILRGYCSEHGIVQQFTIPYNSHQNREERWNLTLLDGIRSSLISSGLPNQFWDEAALCTTYTRNLSPTSALDGKVPHQVWFNMSEPPSVAHLRTFGEKAIMRCPQMNVHQTRKVEPRGIEVTFLGYADNAKGYRLLMPDGCTVTTAIYEDVMFHANTNEADTPLQTSEDTVNTMDNFASDSDVDTDDENNMNENHDAPNDLPIDYHHTSSYLPIQDEPHVFKHRKHGRVSFVPLDEPPRHDINSGPAHTKRISKPPSTANRLSSADHVLDNFLLDIYTEYNTALVWYKSDVTQSSAMRATSNVPLSYSDIQNMDETDRHKWYKASDDEIEQLRQMGTWKLVPLPQGRRPLTTKFVYRIKTDKDGNTTRYKARLVVRGYNQVPGIDYTDIFAPVFRQESLNLFLAIIAYRNMEMIQEDAPGAFLNGKMTENIFVKQPCGYIDKDKPPLLIGTLHGARNSTSPPLTIRIAVMGYTACILVFPQQCMIKSLVLDLINNRVVFIVTRSLKSKHTHVGLK